MELIIESQLEHASLVAYQNLMEEADSEEYFYGIPLDKRAERTVILVGEMVVGFFEHGRVQYEGVWYNRTNRPYTARIHRGHGYMTQALKEWYAIRRPGLAWIDDENISSIRLFQNVGFEKIRSFFHKGKNGHFYRLS